MRIGVDTGGTFTDFVVLDDSGRMESFKLRSNPADPASVILEGIARAAASRKRVEVVHGSTVATNALLERKGARTAFVTTAGFEDMVHIGRQNRPELYNLTPQPRKRLIERSCCFGVHERAHFDGTIERRPAIEHLRTLKRRLERQQVEAVAICLLHSYQNPENEKAVLDALAGVGYVCASHEVSPEFREYERASTTLVNAYVGPLMDAYLGGLERGTRHSISVLQSNGGFITAAEARRHAVRTVLSGPAGGVVGALETARQSGFEKILGFDMGGTSTDVSLSDGRPRETTEASIDGLPIRIPMLDIHTVGAGGGSLARVDEGGLLRVGPESAGADPGPACYGKGEQPTVTDAHVVLGRITAHQLAGGSMEIDPERAAWAVDRVARGLGIGREQAAEGILRVANANMERAIRVVSVERGYDPREFALVAFGGCGGLHACDVAAELGLRTVIVPEHAGALSALGMLLADRVRDYAAGVLGREELEARFAQLECHARREARHATLERLADVRYRGQSYELTVPWSGGVPGEGFHDEHERVYGYADRQRAVEVVTIRVRARVAVAKPALRFTGADGGTEKVSRRVRISGKWVSIPVVRRSQLLNKRRSGPALVVDYGSTTLVAPRWAMTVDEAGNLILRASSSGAAGTPER